MTWLTRSRLGNYQRLDVDEILPGVYISGCSPAANEEILKSLQITHIVNMASLFRNKFPESFSYLKIDIEDIEDEQIQKHFSTVFKFIDSSLTLGGRTLIHCNAGVSRAGTIVTAYVMKSQGLGLKDALKFVRSKRKNNPTIPNDGFMKELKKFEKQLIAVNVIK
ncbi:uncharacterized protein LOC133173329 [Saccostrea echinata]|uniref:uncharacterized protein LOC133173329 n=1 Tax=Saccostrea echinata TaxID=191078 RepID=UPI002A7F7BE2|nr:uncharacterized protein LOC133173329 [Saccostrea echinata]